MDDALVGCEMSGPEQLGGATGHEGPVPAKGQARQHGQRQQQLQPGGGDDRVEASRGYGHRQQHCRPGRT